MKNRDMIYDYRLKIAAINGALPDEFKNKVQSYHIDRWKKIKFHKIVGFNYYNNQELDLQVLNKEIITLKQTLGKLKAENDFLNLINKNISTHNEYNSLIRKYKEEFVEFIESKRKILNVKYFAKLLNIEASTYRFWRQQLKAQCEHASNLVCIKKYPKKLTVEEEFEIVKLLQDPRYEHFPLSAIIWKARHENIVQASEHTWRKIQKQHKIIRIKPKRKRRRNYKSLKSDYVNQYLHADITHFKLLTDKTYYIYIVKDNYSKYIKSWIISDKVTAETRIKTFKESLTDVDLKACHDIQFITDMGAENMNNKVAAFFNKFNNVSIKYARKDIPYSNSMIERYNMDLKYMYLYREKIYSLKQLNLTVSLAVKEHNTIKRLDCLHGQTPYEVYNGVPSPDDWIKQKWEQAKEDRIAKTRSISCCTIKIG